MFTVLQKENPEQHPVKLPQNNVVVLNHEVYGNLLCNNSAVATNLKIKASYIEDSTMTMSPIL